MLDIESVRTVLNAVTEYKWTYNEKGVARHVLYASNWTITIWCPNPDESTKWRIEIKDENDGSTTSVGSIESENVPDELSALVADTI